MAAMAGGLGALKAVDNHAQEAFDAVRARVDKELETGDCEAKVISYKTQVVAGVNFFIKVEFQVNKETKCAHIRVWKKLGNQGYEFNKAMFVDNNEEIKHF